MKKILLGLFVIFSIFTFLSSAHAANVVRAGTSLTGGGSGALDAIACTDLTTGDIGMVMVDNIIYFYRYSSTDSTTESSPSYINCQDASWSAGNWILSNIQGKIVISSDADGMTSAQMLAAGMYGTVFQATGAGTWILPIAVTGMSACLMDSGSAHDLILDTESGSTISLKGTEGSNGVGVTNASGSTTGDFICVVGTAAGKWSTVGMQGTWASQ